MTPACIAELLEPFLGPAGDQRLTTNALAQISTYIDLLLRWNARINLTAIRDPQEIVTRHFGESFFMARHLFPDPEQVSSELGARSSKLVLDLGSGAGFPGIPIKIWAPQIRLTLVESNHKKAAFLREVARLLTLTDVDVIAERAESLALRLVPSLPGSASNVPGLRRARHKQRPETKPRRGAEPSSAGFPRADVVTVRAIEKFGEILALALSFLAPQGRLALLTTVPNLPGTLQGVSLKWQVYYVPKSRNRCLAIAVASETA